MIKRFETILLSEAFEFIQKQDLKVRKKILRNIRIAEVNPNKDLFKKLSNEIWEFHTLYSGVQYRILAFWDKHNEKESLVLATHGFVKKQSKIPKKELDKALRIRIQYLNNRNNEKL